MAGVWWAFKFPLFFKMAANRSCNASNNQGLVSRALQKKLRRHDCWTLEYLGHQLWIEPPNDETWFPRLLPG